MLLVNRSLGISEGLLAPQSLGLVQIHIFTTIPPQLGGIYHQQLWSASSRWQPSESTLGSTGRVSSICSTIVINLLQPSPTFSILSAFSKLLQLSPRGGGLIMERTVPLRAIPETTSTISATSTSRNTSHAYASSATCTASTANGINRTSRIRTTRIIRTTRTICTARTHCTHALHARTTRTHYTHTLHARIARTHCTHYTHALHARTRC